VIIEGRTDQKDHKKKINAIIAEERDIGPKNAEKATLEPQLKEADNVTDVENMVTFKEIVLIVELLQKSEKKNIVATERTVITKKREKDLEVTVNQEVMIVVEVVAEAKRETENVKILIADHLVGVLVHTLEAAKAQKVRDRLQKEINRVTAAKANQQVKINRKTGKNHDDIQ